MIDPEGVADQSAADIDGEINGEIDREVFLRSLGAPIQLADAIQRELAEKAGIGAYLDEVREKGLYALKALVDADAEDRAAIRKHQDAARLYLHLLGFIKEKLVAGDRAEAVLASNRGTPLPTDADEERRDDG